LCFLGGGTRRYAIPCPLFAEAFAPSCDGVLAGAALGSASMATAAKTASFADFMRVESASARGTFCGLDICRDPPNPRVSPGGKRDPTAA
jgi:hypothetical protein